MLTHKEKVPYEIFITHIVIYLQKVTKKYYANILCDNYFQNIFLEYFRKRGKNNSKRIYEIL